jgi:SAM-dependent methyltransferase
MGRARGNEPGYRRRIYARQKMEQLRQFLHKEMEHQCTDDWKVNYLMEALRAEAKIIDTDNISALGYDAAVVAMINKYQNGLILDCGAGRRDTYYLNVINFEIVDCDTTDVLGVGEYLPFQDNVFDAVISIAVLEHVRDPFKCASEISRVLKRGDFLAPPMSLVTESFAADLSMEKQLELACAIVLTAQKPQN